VILNLVWFNVDESPIARCICIVDIAPLNLVRAECRPPDALCYTRESERDRFRDYQHA
jgi:hypothetical protein